MKEIQRFVSYAHEDKVIRDVVTLDDHGFYHITQEVYVDSRSMGIREDIHGRMDSAAYIAWLSNAFKAYSSNAVVKITAGALSSISNNSNPFIRGI